MPIKDYSTDPDLNVSISGINIAEGCPPSGINNAIRQLMADVKVESEAVSEAVSETSSALEAYAEGQAQKDEAQDEAIAEAKSSAEAAKTTADNALPKSGGTMTGAINLNNNELTQVRDIELQGDTHGGYLDFHFAGATDDFTSRIIEESTGGLHLIAVTNGVKVNNKHIVRSVNGVAADAAGNVAISVPATPKAYVTTTYNSGNKGYRKWSDGYIEQWGRFTCVDGENTITFPTAFSSYSIVQGGYEDGNNSDARTRGRAYASNKTTFKIYAFSGAACTWYACGF